MLEMLKAGGLLMLPILGCSILAFAIILEKFWRLREGKIVPIDLAPKVLHWVNQQQLTVKHLQQLMSMGPLGQILSVGLECLDEGGEAMKSRMEAQGRHVIMELEKYLNVLGTIAAAGPLLGLLGTVVGMIQMFSAFHLEGLNQPDLLAAGIAKALITTAFGLSVAIPSLMFHRYFQRRVDELTYKLEREALRLVDGLKKID
ncbi:MAG: MotA/TolQ/ExbB proton channel family protein [Gammaproteobacteria bacterium]